MGRVLFIEEVGRDAPEERKARKGRDFRRHPDSEKAHEGMLEFRSLRDSIRDQASSLSVFYRVRAPPMPEDMDLRIARVSLAIYLLDTLEKMLRNADSRKTESVYPSFESGRKAVREFLDDGYFGKSAVEIVRSYTKCEQTLIHTAARCGVQIIDPEPAVESTKMRVADMIDNINGMF